MTRPQLIHCPSCGEDYAPSYRRCPFCNAKAPKNDPDEEYQEPYGEEELYYEDGYEEPSPRGGKRLSNNRRSRKSLPPHWIIYLLSALVILAAMILLITKLLPKLSPAATSDVPSDDPAVTSELPSADPGAASSDPSAAPGAASALPSAAPGVSALPSETPDPFLELPDPTEPVTSEAPAVSTPAPAVGAKLNHADFTISPRYPDPVQLTVTGGTAAAWTSANESVVTVSASGRVTAAGNGSTTVTCTLDDGSTLTCAVRVNGFTAGSASQPPATEAPAASEAPASEAPAAQAKLNHTDFMINKTYPDPVQLKVIGGTASSWTSKDESVVTVSQTGLVTAVGTKGYTQVTCTLDNGTVLTCDVWVEMS